MTEKKNINFTKRILGIDPGSIITGYGVIDYDGNKMTLVEYGVISAAKKEETFPLRLKAIYERLSQVVERTLPDESAFEAIFFGKNVQSMMKLSHARAAAMLAVTMREIPIAEYAPREVKKSVTGLGNAGKEQVQFMVKKLMSIQEDHQFLDATDALSIAICHCLRSGIRRNSNKSWESFIKNNPDRIKSS
ncbi:MAG: crossover junction endodeoxyribonuclease RuvC [Candidatus Kapabacteria bacterium]|nr:crossover junction endodeoxyribonuclease RuvC [Ignavibacteriota bacterium]MCW5884405.1 crossover junction endodeoxyribonuclease RuvC [Candidatus Kapabacteria bacterium]